MDRSVLGAEVTLIKVPKEQVRSLKLWQEQGDEQLTRDFAINAIGNGDEQLLRSVAQMLRSRSIPSF
jgi:hypothetical protein